MLLFFFFFFFILKIAFTITSDQLQLKIENKISIDNIYTLAPCFCSFPRSEALLCLPSFTQLPTQTLSLESLLLKYQLCNIKISRTYRHTYRRPSPNRERDTLHPGMGARQAMKCTWNPNILTPKRLTEGGRWEWGLSSCRWMVFTMGSLLHHLLSQLLRTGKNAVSLARITFGRGIVGRVWTWEPYGPRPRSIFMSWVGFRVLKQFRTYHPKICIFATLVILSCRLSELHLSA